MDEEKPSSCTCEGCYWFVSFREDCFGDPLEPDWCGYCRHPDNDMTRAGSGEGCRLYERSGI